jgi:uroporphyrinogen decarboxylase
MSLTPRERVLAAVDHREPDRVPTALWGSWYGVTDDLYFELLEIFGWDPVEPFRPGGLHSVNYYDDRLLAELGTDLRYVAPGSTAETSRRGPDGADGWGLKWTKRGPYRAATYHPLAGATAEEIEAFAFPSPEAVRVDQVNQCLEEIAVLDDEYAVVGRAVSSYGFFEMAQALRKHDQLLMDLIRAPEVVHTLVERLFDCYTGLIGRFLDVAGEHLDLLELPGDDFAGNEGPLISPSTFDEFFKTPYQRLIAFVKERAPHIRVVYHSDGAVTPFLPRLIDIGVDVFHPLEPLEATNLEAVKDTYGGELAFLGAVDIRQALPGSEEDVVREVRTRLEQLGGGGGYILAPSNHLQPDVPPENVIALYRAAQELGRYPLELSG